MVDYNQNLTLQEIFTYCKLGDSNTTQFFFTESAVIKQSQRLQKFRIIMCKCSGKVTAEPIVVSGFILGERRRPWL